MRNQTATVRDTAKVAALPLPARAAPAMLLGVLALALPAAVAVSQIVAVVSTL